MIDLDFFTSEKWHTVCWKSSWGGEIMEINTRQRDVFRPLELIARMSKTREFSLKKAERPKMAAVEHNKSKALWWQVAGTCRM